MLTVRFTADTAWPLINKQSVWLLSGQLSIFPKSPQLLTTTPASLEFQLNIVEFAVFNQRQAVTS